MILLKGLALLAVLAVAGHFGTQAIQQRLLYFPDTRRTTPAEADLPDVTEREIVMADGTRVLTWWGAAKPAVRRCFISTATAALSSRARNASANTWRMATASS